MSRRTLVVAGNGMVGHKLVETLLERGADADWRIVVFAEERRLAYDRVGLSAFFDGTSAEELSLVAPGAYDGVEIQLGDAIASIDRDAHTVTSTRGTTVDYDALVLATGSYPFVPPVPGHDLPGCFVYRTLDDLELIRSYAVGRHVGAVVGGGLLGLEAANALHTLGPDAKSAVPLLLALRRGPHRGRGWRALPGCALDGADDGTPTAERSPRANTLAWLASSWSALTSSIQSGSPLQSTR